MYFFLSPFCFISLCSSHSVTTLRRKENTGNLCDHGQEASIYLKYSQYRAPYYILYHINLHSPSSTFYTCPCAAEQSKCQISDPWQRLQNQMKVLFVIRSSHDTTLHLFCKQATAYPLCNQDYLTVFFITLTKAGCTETDSLWQEQ